MTAGAGSSKNKQYDVEQLYSETLSVVLKSPDKEERKENIHIIIEIHTVLSPVHKKELYIQLTDERDPFFFYSLRVTEEDFQQLKSQQGLLVDFTVFPSHFIHLLEQCLLEKASLTPKFLLLLNTSGSNSQLCVGEGSLDVIETNPFKHLCHLSLRVACGSDTQVKKYLAQCIKYLKEERDCLSQKLAQQTASLEQQLHHTQNVLEQKSSELESLKVEWRDHTASLSTRLTQEVSAEKEKTLQVRSELQQRYERERQEVDNKNKHLIQQMEDKINALDKQSKELMDKKYQYEANIRELQGQLNSVEEEAHYLKQDLGIARKQNSSLDADYHEKERAVNQLRTRVAVLEQEVKDKELLLKKQQDLLGEAHDHKTKLGEELQQKQSTLSRRESALKSMSDELIKANEIIQKLQSEIKAQHAKIKVHSQIASGQEKLIGEKDTELADVREELRKVQDQAREMEIGCQQHIQTLETAQKKLEVNDKVIKTNENVINWLNKQLNELQLKQPPVGPSSNGIYVPQYSSTPYSAASQFSSGLASAGKMKPAIGGGGMYQVAANFGRKSGLSKPQVPTVLEEISSSVSPVLKSNEENDPPLDARFFQPTRLDAIPLRGLVRTSLMPLGENDNQVNSAAGKPRSQGMRQQKTEVPPMKTAHKGHKEGNDGQKMGEGSGRAPAAKPAAPAGNKPSFPRQPLTERPSLASAYFPRPTPS